MNLSKLKEAEANFLQRYPDGFAHPDMVEIGKKHKIDQMITSATEAFSQDQFANTNVIVESMIKIISRSSMVSMFEKPKFRDFVRNANEMVHGELTIGLNRLLHGNQQQGFDILVETLKPAKLAKWSLITIIPNYYYPDAEVFVKPTTAKGVIEHFEISDLQYKPLPTWDFYHRYRDIILKMKGFVDDSLKPNNAAFCGFLMMSLNNT